jgi:phospholipid N-methyltransferase
MKLHDLVLFKTQLIKSLSVEDSVEHLTRLRNQIAGLTTMLPGMSADQQQYVAGLVDHYETVIAKTEQPVTELTNYIKTIDAQIEEIVHQLFVGNYQLEEQYGNVEHVRAMRKIKINDEISDIVRQRINFLSSWRYPALEIGCRDGEWTQYLVASDPLYIMDRQQEFLDSTNSRFPEAYQRRLRKYPLVNHDLSALPANQFGFIFSWGYFNYVSMDTMKQYLKQTFDLLRPGGTFMFTYNDGDTPAGSGMAENHAQSYMPKSYLVALCESLGYKIAAEYDFHPYVSWIDIQKPGELETNKAHQVMGEIKRITL